MKFRASYKAVVQAEMIVMDWAPKARDAWKDSGSPVILLTSSALCDNLHPATLRGAICSATKQL